MSDTKISKRQRWRGRPGVRTKYDWDTAALMYDKQHASDCAIGQAIGCSHVTVFNWRVKTGRVAKGTHAGSNYLRIIEMAVTMSNSQIARELRLTPPAITKALKRRDRLEKAQADRMAAFPLADEIDR